MILFRFLVEIGRSPKKNTQILGIFQKITNDVTTPFRAPEVQIQKKGVRPQVVKRRGAFTKTFRYLKWRNPDPYKAVLGVGGNPYISRIHTAYIGEDSSILGT